jgi:hypothetical protein
MLLESSEEEAVVVPQKGLQMEGPEKGPPAFIPWDDAFGE